MSVIAAASPIAKESSGSQLRAEPVVPRSSRHILQLTKCSFYVLIAAMIEPRRISRNQLVFLRGTGATVSVAMGLSAALLQGFLKASADDPEHPGWPAGTPGGLGGKFRPKDGPTAGAAAVRRLALRKAIRAALLQALSLPLEAAANVFPALGEAADVVMVTQLAETFAEFHQLDIDTKAALDFFADGAHSLDDLRVSPDSEAFSSYDAFKKDASVEAVEEWLLKRFGAAGDGYQYHHIVEQGGSNSGTFSAQELQSTDNIIRIPTLLHEAINSQYSSGPKGNSLRQQLGTQTFSEQFERGLNIMRDLGIIKDGAER